MLRGVWSAQGQTSADLDETCGHGSPASGWPTSASTAWPSADDDLRAAWRDRLEREGKLNADGGSVARPGPRAQQG